MAARRRTVWRFSSPDYDVMCQIHQLPNERAALRVIENGRVVERRVIRGTGDQALQAAWHKAVALHGRHHRRAAPKLAEARRQPPLRVHAVHRKLQRQLFPAIHRVEQSRTRVLRDLESLESRAHDIVEAVKDFRAAWEVLDLEHHVLTGRSLSVDQYHQRLRPHASE